MNRFQTIPRFVVTYGVGDVSTALFSLFKTSPPPPEGLDEMFRGSAKFWTGSGRQALWLILKSLNLPPGAGVAVPLYTDFAVLQTISASGLKPVFIDIDERTLTMSPVSLSRVRERISAVVAVHLFGHVAPVMELQDAAPGVPLIEDTVHAPLSFLGNRLVGTMGVGCFYSFGSSKCWPAGGGGIAVVNEEKLAVRVRADLASLIPQSLKEKSWNLICQTAKSAIFRKPMYGVVARPLRASMERYALLEPVLDLRAIQPGQAAVALRQIKAFGARVEAQREHSLRLLSALRGVPDVVLPVEPPGTRYNYHFFPVLLSDAEERDAVTRKMLSRSVDTSRVYFNVVEDARKLGYTGGCPAAESAPQRMLTLPNYAGLSNREVDYVAEIFIESLAAFRTRRKPQQWVVRAQVQQKSGMGAS